MKKTIVSLLYITKLQPPDIFYGRDFVPYLISVTFTTGDHPIGIIGPGILKSPNKLGTLS
ncbi:MAG: hypothetical protein ACOC5S_06125 [Acidobacteriota bacterium]